MSKERGRGRDIDQIRADSWREHEYGSDKGEHGVVKDRRG
jgi:hypothetical protein